MIRTITYTEGCLHMRPDVWTTTHPYQVIRRLTSGEVVIEVSPWPTDQRFRHVVTEVGIVGLLMCLIDE